MRILVTGASGFVGTNAADYLETLGHEIVRFVGPGKRSVGASFSVDIADAATFPDVRSVSPLDAVIHTAGIAHRFGHVSKEDFERVNVDGVANVIRFAEQASARKFVLLSSVLVYGTPRDSTAITEDRPTAPDDDYAISKCNGEQEAIRLCEEASLNLSILRPAPIVGEGGRGNVSRLIKAIDRGRFLWVGSGSNKRSFVYVGDVSRAIGEIIDRDIAPNSVFNLVGGTISVTDLVGVIVHKLDRRVPRFRIPTIAARVFQHASAVAGPIPGVQRFRRTLATWLADAVYSGEKAERELGFIARATIEEAIGREVDHYLRNK